MAESLVLYEVRSGAAVITFNRPDRMNGWTPPLQEAYFDSLVRAAGDNDVRAIVVTGAGRGFCPGADIEYLKAIESEGKTAQHRDPLIFPLEIPKLMVAAINGACAGIGLIHALVCDIRFISSTAKVTTAFSRRGLVAEHAMAWLLPGIIGTSRAADLLLSGRVISAGEAVEMGLAGAAVDPEELMPHALSYAQDVAANCSPASIAAMKKQLRAAHTQDVETAYAESAALMATAVKGFDFVEGVASFVEKRSPKFPPLGKGTVFH